MSIPVKVPSAGESVHEGMIETWHKKNGDYVEQDELLLEIETDKSTQEVFAESSGKLTILKQKGEMVKVGETIASLEKIEKPKATAAPTQVEESQNKPSEAKEEKATDSIAAKKSSPTEVNNGPAVNHLSQENKIDLSQVKATGRGGRITKEDLVHHSKPQESKPHISSSQKSTEERTTRREPLSMLRRRVGERLLAAQKNAAILTTFNEVDLSQVSLLRKKYKDSFQKTYDVKLGFMGFFLKAATYALEKFPKVNAYIEEDTIVYHNYCDIGVAVSTAKGLVVPVIQNVEKLNLGQIEQAITNYADKARNNKISLNDLNGGTFTVSNGGVFGSLMSTPILNPPQSAILGMHKIQQRPMVTEDGKIEARPMMYLALSYDHRVIDGKESVSFLKTIKECLEDPARILIGV